MENEINKWRKVCFNFTEKIKWLTTTVTVSPFYQKGVVKKEDDLRFELSALWDTGSTTTIIDVELAEKLNLQEVAIEEVMHLVGHGETKVYFIDLYLPENIVIQRLRVISMPLKNAYFSMILGMDVIQLGKFSIENKGEKVTMEFEIFPTKKIKVT